MRFYCILKQIEKPTASIQLQKRGKILCRWSRAQHTGCSKKKQTKQSQTWSDDIFVGLFNIEMDLPVK